MAEDIMAMVEIITVMAEDITVKVIPGDITVTEEEMDITVEIKTIMVMLGTDQLIQKHLAGLVTPPTCTNVNNTDQSKNAQAHMTFVKLCTDNDMIKYHTLQ